MPAVLRCLLIALLVILISACNGSGPTTAGTTTPAADAQVATQAQSEETVRIGDITIRASAVQTSMLAPGVTRQYGITRNAKTVLLVVAIRQGINSDAFALPATVTASVTDLRGSRHDLTMRELHSGDPETGTDLVDYVSTVQTSLPDTLRFDIRVQPEGVEAVTLQLSRDF